MKDRISLYPGRVTLTPVSGQENTYDMVRADQPMQEGTPLSKGTLFKDTTAALYGLGTDAVPDEALELIARGVCSTIIVTNTADTDTVTAELGTNVITAVWSDELGAHVLSPAIGLGMWEITASPLDGDSITTTLLIDAVGTFSVDINEGCYLFTTTTINSDGGTATASINGDGLLFLTAATTVYSNVGYELAEAWVCDRNGNVIQPKAGDTFVVTYTQSYTDNGYCATGFRKAIWAEGGAVTFTDLVFRADASGFTYTVTEEDERNGYSFYVFAQSRGYSTCTASLTLNKLTLNGTPYRVVNL